MGSYDRLCVEDDISTFNRDAEIQPFSNDFNKHMQFIHATVLNGMTYVIVTLCLIFKQFHFS